MAERTWTKDQCSAFSARNGTLIVSAAAGSGKTTVLVKRVIERLTDPVDPCNADELLIVTFTRAATSEMRSRLANAIQEELSKDPTNENLQRQQMLLPSAHICTIDSFCGSLVREHFESLQISPDFRMLDQNELNVLEHAAVTNVVEELYEENDPAFSGLVELLFSGRDDTTIEDTIIRLYNYSRAYPSPESWLKNAISGYEHDTDYRTSPITNVLVSSAHEVLDFADIKINEALELLEGSAETSILPCAELVRSDREFSKALREKIDSLDFEAAAEMIGSRSTPNWNASKLAKDPYVLEARSLRNDYIKPALSEKLLPIIISSMQDAAKDAEKLLPVAKKLVEAVHRFEACLNDMKKERNALDFSDVELMALGLLVEDPSAEIPVPKPLAKDLSDQFKEILIDEYQDTNKLQDMLFGSISKDGSNLFMVGDVKQSIYRFRQAMPEIFLDKKNRFPIYDPATDNYPATVILGQNFRSRKGILDFVNYTCGQLMSPELGDIKYDNTEMLYYGASYPERDESDVEFHILQDNGLDDKKTYEAAYIAKQITRMKEESEGTDHPLKFSDFSILLRTAKGTANVYEKTLREMGIPVYSDTGSGFLCTADVQIMVSMLRIIDNPLQDIPLLSVLMSPIFGFTADEIAEIRINNRYGQLYPAVLQEETAGNKKAAAFCNTLRLYRRLSVSLPAGELLRRIYEDTAFPAIAGAMPNGTQRTANLRLLLKYADSFDQTETFGISGFIRYLDRMEDNDVDPASASTISPNANVVRIMSIHKSKGLEFPVCFLADTSHQFNTENLKKALILHPSLGIGLKGRDISTGNTYPSYVHTAIKLETERSELSEALRVLYVAMTRAKNTLIITGTDQNSQNSHCKKARLLNAHDPIPPYAIRHSSSFFDWLFLAVLRHPDAKELRELCDDVSIETIAADFRMNIVYEEAPKDTEEEETFDITKEIVPDHDLARSIEEKISYEYPYAALAGVSSKRAASSIAEVPFESDFFASSQPEFISRKGLTPAQRGICLHRFMQYSDFAAAEHNPGLEIQRMVHDGFLTGAEASVIPPEKIRKFFNSEVYQRIKGSSATYREKKFAVLVGAGVFDHSLPKELASEPVLIQGIADCVFVEDGQLVILDYKTDNINSAKKLIEMYQPQLVTYAYALSHSMSMPVKEIWLYSFALGKEIPVPLN